MFLTHGHIMIKSTLVANVAYMEKNLPKNHIQLNHGSNKCQPIRALTALAFSRWSAHSICLMAGAFLPSHVGHIRDHYQNRLWKSSKI